MKMPTGKKTEAEHARRLIAGFQKHLSNSSSLMLESGTYTPAQIESFLQTLIDLHARVDDAKTATKAKLAELSAEAPLLRSRMAALKAFVKTAFSKSPDVLADFGIQPKKASTPLTIEKKAAAAAKRKATRAMRHTMGAKQKRETKGTITTIVAPSDSKASQPVTPSPVAGASLPKLVACRPLPGRRRPVERLHDLPDYRRMPAPTLGPILLARRVIGPPRRGAARAFPSPRGVARGLLGEKDLLGVAFRDRQRDANGVRKDASTLDLGP